MKLTSKSALSVLFFSIPLNFIAIEGIGNLYASTLIILIEFFFLFFLTKGNILTKKDVLFSLVVFLSTVLVTVVNVVFFDRSLIKIQTVNTFIYLQNTLVFILVYHFHYKISLNTFLNSFLIIAFVSTLRVFIEEPDHVFMLSTAANERIEALFIGGVNNFALIVGLAFLISFFYIKNKTLRICLSLYWLIIVILTMSRGALLGLIITLFITSIYDTNRKTLRLLIRYSLLLMLLGILALILTGKMDLIIDKVEDRFFSVFNGKTKLDDFFSGRGALLIDIFSRMSDSSIFQILFGHGNGGIDFYNTATKQDYETSHNILIDIFYRNGLFFFILYLMMIWYLLLLFLQRRSRDKLAIFGTFVFFHLELLVNPILFAAQTGWLYAIFIVLFLKQNKMKGLEENNLEQI
ncbi:O-antigen ligase family protein [Aquimarina macrocephali]|uniref:O-antigen ligase family protein n=1 Tax=Aquimarina macrocephali TaxID=666563 RepID=UPI003F66A9EF